MFAILGEHGGSFALPVAADDEEIVRTLDRERFEELLEGASAALILCPLASDDPDFFAWLVQLVHRHQATPLVALAPLEAHTARALPQEITVAWRGDDPEDVLAESRRVARPDPAAFMAHVTRTAERAPAPFPQVMRVLEGEPISRVKDLLTKLGFSRSYLYATWREACPSVRPKELVDVVLLTRALTLATRGLTHFEIAQALAVDESTLNRLSRRWTGRLLARGAAIDELKEMLSILEDFVRRIPEGKPDLGRRSVRDR
jgi:hypothetical protein